MGKTAKAFVCGAAVLLGSASGCTMDAGETLGARADSLTASNPADRVHVQPVRHLSRAHMPSSKAMQVNDSQSGTKFSGGNPGVRPTAQPARQSSSEKFGF
jgi:hypothetical protein